ncbi:MAG: hypothetical protein GEV12_08775 [Micromonosporaceae bacterium]|nr:hypothetical protein [Micromonosporaceae bacterium]
MAVAVADRRSSLAGSGPPQRVVRLLAGTEPAVTHRTGDGWVTLTAPEPDDQVTGAAETFTVRLTKAARTGTGDVSAATVANWLVDPARPEAAGLASLLPPFAAAHRGRSDGPVVVAGDWLGARALFWWQGAGAAAVSTSALALAALAGTGLDRAALGVQSLLGWQTGVDTVFQGVTKLGPGCLAVLHHGRVSVHQYAEPAGVRPGPDRPEGAAVVEGMADLLRTFHDTYLTDHPDAVLQLSGGLDSRLLLCAVPPRLRRDLAAFTLDVRAGAEARIACRLAARSGLAHHVYLLDEQPPVSPAAAHAMVVEAAVALDCMASPLALAPLARFETMLAQGNRLAGTGGEIARGFYYPGQPHRATTSPALVDRLARWRLFTNEAVAPEALDPDFAAFARSVTLDRLTTRLAGYGPGWLRATDEFYLFDRVQRWAGAHSTVAAVARGSVNPLLDRRFVQLALAATPDQTRSSRLIGQVVSRLDPRLAAVPLDSGLIPARLAEGGLVAHGQRHLATGRKIVGKVRQRLVGRRRGQLGAAELARLVVAHWVAAPETIAPVRDTGLVPGPWLDRLVAGHVVPDPATVTFLVNLLVASQAADGRRPPGPSEPGEGPVLTG